MDVEREHRKGKIGKGTSVREHRKGNIGKIGRKNRVQKKVGRQYRNRVPNKYWERLNVLW